MKNKLPNFISPSGLVLLAGLVILLLLVALIVVPEISARTGISGNVIALAGAALFFIAAFASIAMRKHKAGK